MIDIFSVMTLAKDVVPEEEEDFTIKPLNDVWDYVNSINANKNIFANSESPEIIEKEYNPWIVNKAFSYFYDTVKQANKTNMSYHLDKKLQYMYLLNTVSPKKRFSKWAKKDKKPGDIELVKQVYGYSQKKAEVALSLLSAEQIKELKRRLSTGGLKK
jgi:hypothetical protein